MHKIAYRTATSARGRVIVAAEIVDGNGVLYRRPGVDPVREASTYLVHHSSFSEDEARRKVDADLPLVLAEFERDHV